MAFAFASAGRESVSLASGLKALPRFPRSRRWLGIQRASGQVIFPLQRSSLAGGARQFSDWAHLDTADVSGWHLRGDLEGVVQVGGVNQIEACQDLFCFGERTIPDGHLAVADAHSFGGMNGLEGLRGKASASAAEGLVVSHTLVIGHGSDFLLFTVDQA